MGVANWCIELGIVIGVAFFSKEMLIVNAVPNVCSVLQKVCVKQKLCLQFYRLGLGIWYMSFGDCVSSSNFCV